MTFSRNIAFAALAFVAALFFILSGASVKATDHATVQFEQRVVPQMAPSHEWSAESLAAPVARVVITGHRMTEAEKAAFDRDPT